jgi:hypothetical protein
MFYKKRSQVAHLPNWLALSLYVVSVVCATSGVLYLLGHEFSISVVNFENHSILTAHGFSAYFFVMLFGSVMPNHIKAGWKNKRNIVLGSIMTAVIVILLITGLFLYYGDEIRDAALWVHWVLGGSLVVLFPLHLIFGRRANYLALKKHSKTNVPHI